MNSTTLPDDVEVSARNIGGIDETAVSLRPGVNVLSGRNATNRTSFLQTVMAALGSDRTSLKADADEGYAELTLGGETYTRTFERRNGTVLSDGSPYLDDPTVADLFAFLLETNEARLAVQRGDDLRDIIMRPVDTEAIRSRIEEIVEERQELDERLDELGELRSQLPELEQRRTELDEKIETKRAELAEKEEEIAAADADVQETREEKAELDERLDDLQEARSELEEARFQLETERESLEALEEELAELEEMRESLPDAPETEIGELDAEIERLRGQKQQVDSGVSELQSVIQFNEEMIEGGVEGIGDALGDVETNGGAVTDQLVEDSQNVVCWTCGSEVEKTAIEGTVERLRNLRESWFEERNDIEDDIEDCKAERDRLKEQRRRREEIATRIEETESEIAQRKARIETLEERRGQLANEVRELESTVEELESQDYSEILDLHKEANQIEFELGRLENEFDDLESEIEAVEAELEQRDELEARREEIATKLPELRTKIDAIEADAVEAFNDHMESLLEILGYENLERVWIERVRREVKEGRRKAIKSMFDLHIVRQTASGTAYEDTIDHLSESEREVIGLVFALAGYLTHDVAESVPFMLLDSLEAIDSERIAELVDYMREYAPYMIVALLPEDASSLDEAYHYVREI